MGRFRSHGFNTTPHILSITMKATTTSKTTSSRANSTHRSGQSAPHHETAAHPSADSPRLGKCVLLVDDDPTVRDSLNDVLVSEGYLVIPAENGQQALELAASSSVDLVLLDLNMPVKNGWDTFERLTAENPLTPILIITARPNQLFTALSAGVGALLEKPVDIPTLLRTMNDLLAEPPEQRLARMGGQCERFFYQPTEVRQSPPSTQHWGINA